MSTEETKKLLRRFYDALGSNDWETCASLCDDNIVFEYPGYEHFVGIKSFGEFIGRMHKMYPGHHQTVKKDGCYVAEGEWAVVEYEVDGYLANGAEYRHSGYHILKVCGQKIISLKVIYDTFSHIKAVMPLLGPFPLMHKRDGVLFEK